MDHNYLILTVSVLMFGIQFYLNSLYQKENGTAPTSVFTFSFLGAVSGALCLCIINGFNVSTTPFTLIFSFVTALNSILCSACTLKSLEKVNLSLYSLFSMLGGMLLPFLVGICFYREPLTLATVLCVTLTVGALALTVDRNKRRGGEIYYIGVFFFNGMSGVLSKIYGEAPFKKVNSAGYSLWIALMSALISLFAILILRKRFHWPSLKATALGFGGGVLNRVANFLLLVALISLPASVQYPFVTGGVIIVSTLLSFLTKQKPSPREVISVVLAFVGIILLVVIPI